MHRVGQFVAHVRARVEPEEEALVQPHPAGAAACALFESMPVADRRHGLDVAEELLRGGHDDHDLLGAALLHDAAKGHRMRLWHRVAGVLLEALAPSLLRRLAEPRPDVVAAPVPPLPAPRADVGRSRGRRRLRASRSAPSSAARSPTADVHASSAR